jgi:hypothetical protein
MVDKENKMKSFGFFVVISIVTMFCGCGTQPQPGRSQNPADAIRQYLESRYDQDLNETETEKIENYKLLTGVVVDELSDHIGNDYFEIDLNRAVYEVYSLLRLFGLHEKLTNEEKSIVVEAIYRKMPSNIDVGTPIRNIIIPSYFSDNTPLILHITFAYSGNRHPTIVVLTNTRGNIRSSGYKDIQNNGIGFKYPRIATIDEKLVIQSDNNYTMALLSDKIISASSSIDKELPPIDENGDTFEMLNLADDYLRDGNIGNDDAVLPILNKTINDGTKEPLEYVFANLQLYIYYLFKNDLEYASEIIDNINKSGLLDDPAIKDTDLADIVEHDMKNILEIINLIKLH